MRAIFTGAIQVYQVSMRFLRAVKIPWIWYSECRFYPSCSEYSKEAIQKHGILLGMRYSTKRLMRCHPYSAGGVDLVP